MSDDPQIMTSSYKQQKAFTTATNLFSTKHLQTKCAKSTNKLKKDKSTNSDYNTVNVNTSSTQSSNSKDHSSGSVVITIRLLKMEAAKNASTNQHSNEQIGNCSLINKQNECSTSNMIGADQHNEYIINSNVTNPLNSIENMHEQDNNTNSSIRYNSDNNINDAKSYSDDDANALTYYGNELICDNDNGGKTDLSNIKYKKNVCVSPSETLICDKVKTMHTSQSNDTVLILPSNSDCKIPANDLCEANTSPKSVDIFNKSITDTASGFIPKNLINSVSPYPHHIPIANIMRSDCVAAMNAEESMYK